MSGPSARGLEAMAPTSIVDLPGDVLHQIFDHFQLPGIREKADFRWTHRHPLAGHKERLRIIQNARLVCRVLNKAASRFLCPILHVRLDQESLSRAERLCQNPFIAAGVWGVQVILCYRPAELTTSLERFKNCQVNDLRPLYQETRETSRRWYPYRDESDISGYPASEDNPHAEAIDCYKAMCSAWDNYLSPTEGDVSETDLEYQRILCQSYEAFRDKGKEQLRLITDGSFVGILAASLSLLRPSVRVSIVDEVVPWLHGYIGSSTRLLRSPKLLLKFMKTPYNWKEIEAMRGAYGRAVEKPGDGDMDSDDEDDYYYDDDDDEDDEEDSEIEGGAQLVPARILMDLPIACHKAGKPIRNLNIACFPLTTGFSMICPGPQGSVDTAWAALRAACQQLEEFVWFGPSLSTNPYGTSDFLPEDKVCIDNYLGAVLSGPLLEEVSIPMNAFCLDHTIPRKLGAYPLGRVLSTVQWPCIRRVSIEYISMTEDELKSFCKALGPDISLLRFDKIAMTSTTWRDSLDVLHELATRSSEKRCKVQLDYLTGGGLGQDEEGSGGVDPWNSWQHSPLALQARRYASGAEATNPLQKG